MEAEAVRDGKYLVVVCPYCGRVHIHGNPDDSKAPTSRRSHCLSDPRVYVLHVMDEREIPRNEYHRRRFQ